MDIRAKLVNPNMKVFRSPSHDVVVLLIDDYDEATGKSVILEIEMPDGQADEWSKALRTPG